MKIAVKNCLVNKVRAKPAKSFCDCNWDMNLIKFYHKRSCKGEVYLGEINKEKIVVCSNCESITSYDRFIWICPICGKKSNYNHNLIHGKESSNLIRYDSGQKFNPDNEETERDSSRENRHHKEEYPRS